MSRHQKQLSLVEDMENDLRKKEAINFSQKSPTRAKIERKPFRQPVTDFSAHFSQNEV